MLASSFWSCNMVNRSHFRIHDSGPVPGPALSWRSRRNRGCSTLIDCCSSKTVVSWRWALLQKSWPLGIAMALAWEAIYGCVWKQAKPLNLMVLLIIIPMKNGYFIGKMNPTFSDKPIYLRMRYHKITPKHPWFICTSPHSGVLSPQVDLGESPAQLPGKRSLPAHWKPGRGDSLCWWCGSARAAIG